MDKANRTAQLDGLAALLEAELGDVDAGLKKLESLTDPDSIRRRISILITDKKYDQAAKAAIQFPLDPAFVEIAVRALMLNGDITQAFATFDKVAGLKDDTNTLPRRTLVSLTDGLLVYHQLHSSEPTRTFLAMEPEVREAMSRAKKLLAADAERTIKNVDHGTPLDAEVVALFAMSCGMLGDSLAADGAMTFIARHRHLVKLLPFAQLVATGRLRIFDGLTEELLSAKEDTDAARILAGAILASWRGDAVAAFQMLNIGLHAAKTADIRAQYFLAMLDISRLAPRALDSVIDSAASIELDPNESLHNTCIARLKLYRNDPESALVLLDTQPLDADPRWLETKARCLDAVGDKKQSLALLAQVASMTLTETGLIEVIDQARRLEDTKVALAAAINLVKYYPWIKGGRRNLAALLIQDGQPGPAAVELERLALDDPEDMAVRSELSRVYMILGRLDDAEEGFRKVNSKPEPSLPAVIMWSQSLRALGRVNEAFAALDRNRPRFWSDKDFLGEYLTCGYAAGHEDASHEALMALEDLRQRGLLEPERLRLGSIEDILALVEQNRKRQEETTEQIITGKFPWSFAAELFNMSVIWNWTTRTQPLRQQSEERSAKSLFTLYSTNSFGVDFSEEQEGEVSQITPPQKGGAVCLDVTALITLHKLGLVSKLATMFSEVLVTDRVLSNLVAESQRLLPHQLSSAEGYAHLRKLVATQGVAVVSERLPFHVDEYKHEPTDFDIPLSVLEPSLIAGGLLDAEALGKFRLLARRQLPPNVQPLGLRAKLSLDIETAMSLYRMQLLDVVIENYSVSILENEYKGVQLDLVTFDAQEDAYKALQAMVTEVRALPNVRFVGSKLEGDGTALNDSSALAGFQIALDRGIPLLADDRVLQAMMINQRRTTAGVAFGSDVFLLQLHSEGMISAKEFADSYLSLIKWRYRFLLPPSSVLKELFNRYPDCVPGSSVVLVTRYMHDSFADPGLFAAPERARVPVSVAMRMMMTWVKEITQFLADVLTSDDVPEARCVILAEWIGAYMLPAVPANLAGRQESLLGSYLPRSCVAYTLLASGSKRPNDKFHKALKKLSDTVGLSEREYEQVIAEVIQNAFI